jgi:hypothetical protein
MKEIEKLFKENKDSFDRLVPSENLWEHIKNSGFPKRSMPSTKQKRNLLQFAAILFIAFGISLLIINKSEDHTHFNDLTMISVDGEEVRLDPSLNKYTLIQFWASGNVLCSEENCYYYLPAYTKYKDKGFEIYSISLDKDRETWLKTIEENDLPWIHVSDLKGWESPICIECNITKIPSSFLLNQKGDIIARDLNAKEIVKKLDKLLAQN